MALISPNKFTTEEWLTWRREGIGGSDAPSILGAEGAFSSPYDVWEEKTQGTTKEDNYAMRMGRDKEGSVREWFEEQSGLSFFPMLSVHDDHSWIRASLDGIELEGRHAVEIKNLGEKDHSIAVAGGVPQKYFIQCQHQMMATPSLEKVYYVSCPIHEEAQKSVVIEINRDARFIEEILFPEENKFWMLVKSGTAPERIFKDLEKDSSMERLVCLHRQIKELEKEKEKISDSLKSSTEGRGGIGFGYKFYPKPVSGRIDYEAAVDAYLEELQRKYPQIDLLPVDFENHRKSSFTQWSLSAIKKRPE